MINIEEIAQKFKCYGKIDLFFNENLSVRTSFKIGGAAALLIEPLDTDALCFAMNTIRKAGIPFFVLGGGTNCVFADAGFEGIVVSTRKLAEIKLINNSQLTINNSVENQTTCNNQSQTIHYSLFTIHCTVGASMNAVVNFATENGLSGLEEFAGLPGTVGGAVYMNARCFEKEISDVVQKIFWIEFDGAEYVQKEKIFAKSEWSYKKSPFTDCGGDKIITGVEFIVRQQAAVTGNSASADSTSNGGVMPDSIETARNEIAERCKGFVQQRKEKGHFEYPCAGSVFKNNHAFGEPSGKIIEGLGLKGRQIGGAQIAPFHGNIIINTGGATCTDVRALVELIKREAKEQRGFELEEEIIFVEGQ